MSAATTQSIAMLALVAGCASEINRRNLISHIGVKNTIESIKVDAEKCINAWGETGDPHKNTEQITKWFEEWEKKYYGLKKMDNESATELVSICDHLLSDMLGQLRNPRKRKMISELLRNVQEVYTWLDDEWRNYPAMERAGVAVDKLNMVMR
jgi:hypothetical protein